MLIVVNYHYVGMKVFPHPGVHGLSIQEFNEHLNYLESNFEIIGLNNLDNIIPSKSYCLLTFDDGLKCHYDIVYKILKKRRIPAVFFIISQPLRDNIATLTHKTHYVRSHMNSKLFYQLLKDFCSDNRIYNYEKVQNKNILYKYDSTLDSHSKYILNFVLNEKQRKDFVTKQFGRLKVSESNFNEEWYMSSKEIKEIIKDNFFIGSHTHSHAPLAKINKELAFSELKESKSILENKFNCNISAVSYPQGNEDAVSRREADMAEEIGYKYGFTVEREANITIKDPLMLARIDCNDLPVVGKYPNFLLHNSMLKRTDNTISKRNRYINE
jgi:peptidoglycan/xylan/chitin deacetylase (PgdA/CDA1 family)